MSEYHKPKYWALLPFCQVHQQTLLHTLYFPVEEFHDQPLYAEYDNHLLFLLRYRKRVHLLQVQSSFFFKYSMMVGSLFSSGLYRVVIGIPF